MPATAPPKPVPAEATGVKREIKNNVAAPPIPPSDGELNGEKDDVPTDPTGVIEMEVFMQIREMDEEDDEEELVDGGDPHSFSRGIVWGFFEQAENTFAQMEAAILLPSLSQLSALGHFLKGSSAALGIIKVQASCEKMQHYGNLRDEEVGVGLTEEEALKRIKVLLKDCRRDYEIAKAWMKRLYGEQ